MRGYRCIFRWKIFLKVSDLYNIIILAVPCAVQIVTLLPSPSCTTMPFPPPTHIHFFSVTSTRAMGGEGCHRAAWIGSPGSVARPASPTQPIPAAAAKPSFHRHRSRRPSPCLLTEPRPPRRHQRGASVMDRLPRNASSPLVGDAAPSHRRCVATAAAYYSPVSGHG